MQEPKYLKIARAYIGVKELTGNNDSPVLLSWWQRFNAKWLNGQPWCGLFVAECMAESGLPYPKDFYRAHAWLDCGVKIYAPTLGCIVIFERKGGGHVGFVVGRDSAGNLLVLGGNQGNKVSVAAFPLIRVLGYRLPNSTPRLLLPQLSLGADLSQSEA